MRKMTIVVAAFALAACVRADGSMIDDRTAVVSASGGGANGHAVVVKRAMIEAAEIGRARGYSHFVVLSSQDTSGTGLATNTATGSVVAVARAGQGMTVRYLHADEVMPGMAAFEIASILANQ